MSVVIFILLLIGLIAALAFGVFFGFKRCAIQTGIRAGMVLISVIAAAILACTLKSQMFTGIISLFQSFSGAEVFTYLLSDAKGAEGLSSFVQAMAAPVLFLIFFLGFTIIFIVVYRLLRKFIITDKRLKDRAERAKEKEGGVKVADEVVAEEPSDENAAAKTEAEQVEEFSYDYGLPSTYGENGNELENVNDGGYSAEASAEETAEETSSEYEIAVAEADDGDKKKKKDKKKKADGDKKERKKLPPAAKRAIIVAVNVVCAVMIAVSVSVPVTSFVSACAGVVEGVGGADSAKAYVDEINSDGDTTQAKDFITNVSDLATNPLFNIYKALGVPVSYSITGVSVGDSDSQPLDLAIASSDKLLQSVVELVAKGDLLSKKVTWPDYATVLYTAADKVAVAPYWNKLIGNVLKDASNEWREGKEFIGIKTPFNFGYETLEKDIYIILSESDDPSASVELRAVADALCAMAGVAGVWQDGFDVETIEQAFELLITNVDESSAKVVKSYINAELIKSIGLPEDYTEAYITLFDSLLDGAVKVNTATYADDAARTSAIKAEAEATATFLRFTNNPDDVSNTEFVNCYYDSTVVKSMVAALTDDGAVNNPMGVAERITSSRLSELKDMLAKGAINAAMNGAGSSSDEDYEKLYDYMVAYITA